MALYLACFRDYRDKLAPGEVGTLPVIAADRKQARTVMRYIVGFIDAVPMLHQMVANRTEETIELTNRVTIEVHTASFRALRGYSLIGVVCDEIAFWSTDDAGANPDTEILNGLRPGMATVPGAVLLAISSPYARRGALWEAYRRHYGRDGDSVLVWQADTRSMNPSVDPQLIADAYVADEAAAAAEYGAEFRRDIESFISREAIDAVVIAGRQELAPVPGRKHVAFVDPSGGSQDSMTLAIAHQAVSGPVLDAVRERRPPFNPAEVVEEIAATLRAYGVSTITGDHYAGEWPREAFRAHGIRYEPSERSKSEVYGSLLPLINARQVELLDNQRLIAQLATLERRTARSGRDSIDHAPGGHDDVINAAAGALGGRPGHRERRARFRKCRRLAITRARGAAVSRDREPPPSKLRGGTATSRVGPTHWHRAIAVLLDSAATDRSAARRDWLRYPNRAPAIAHPATAMIATAEQRELFNAGGTAPPRG